MLHALVHATRNKTVFLRQEMQQPMQHSTQPQDIQALAQRALTRLGCNSACNADATTLGNLCNKPGSKSADFVASEKSPQIESEKRVGADKPRVVAGTNCTNQPKRGSPVWIYRVHVDNKSLIFMDHTRVADVRGLMDKQFGADRVGAIVPIGVPGSREAS